MERKWYLDLWALIRDPFKRGIPEIVEFGTIQRGFAAFMAMAAISFILQWCVEIGMAYAFGTPHLQLGSLLGRVAGTGFFAIVLSAILSFIVLVIYSVIFSQIANKLGSNTNYESVLKICWYQSAYSSVLSLIMAIIQWVLIIIVNGFGLNEILPEIAFTIINLCYAILEFVAFIWFVWVSLTLMGRQIEKNRLITLCITIISALIPILFIGVLVWSVFMAIHK